MDREHIEAELDGTVNSLLRLLADISLDEGDEEMSAGYLWLSEWNKHPNCEKDQGQWQWWWISIGNHESLPYRLPLRVEPVYHSSLHKAYRVAAKEVGKWVLASEKALLAEVQKKIAE